uniref:Integrin alpha FG-GAP repeat containing 1 n=1 Tax=Callorhinchus milii TaxID=7868 RepID=A0A4W3J5B8_CALMI
MGPALELALSALSALSALLLLLLGPRAASALQDVTAELFRAEAHGVVAAFGDFNSDKQTDIFLIRSRKELVILLADVKVPYFKPNVKLQLGDKEITSVMPGDYDGDSQMDVLLTVHPKDLDEITVIIFWGNNRTLGKCPSILIILTLYSFVGSFNGDMIPDVFGATTKTEKPQICSFTGRNQTCNIALDSAIKMRVPHSHAFIDLNKDFTAGKLLNTLYEHRKCVCVVSDGNGQQEHLLPVCMDANCQQSLIYRNDPGSEEWIPVLTNLKNGETIWGFVPQDTALPHSFPITIHIGDYNMDGFPDALAILRNTSGSNKQAFLLENVPCNNASCKSVGRMFRVLWELSDLNKIKNAVVATFFDIYEDGILDLLVVSEDTNAEFSIHALRNNFDADAYFVKVIVLSGLCSSDCPYKITPFGVNQPGPYIMYTTADSNGYLKNASAGQLSQSAHFALQLPYVVLGLGRSANFLDHLYVGIPRPLGEKSIRKQEWTAIIPNSQLIVIPYPHNSPKSWSAKLYLTPSNIVLLTAIALIGVCVFILAIIGILHWKEKKADDREKRQEAHRFHFDAM